MLRAVFARTLRTGVTYEEFRAAWVPENAGPYPHRVSVGRDLTDDRRIITIIELDIEPDELPAILPTLFRPDALGRIGELVVSTELEGVYEQVMDEPAA